MNLKTNPQKHEKTSFKTIAKHALRGRCPNCGKGKLFSSYLKQVESCSQCNEKLGHIQADDGPAWLTILIIGHIAVPIIISVEMNNTLPQWATITIWPTLITLLALAFLPKAKGLFIGMIWRTNYIEAKNSDKNI